MFGRSDEDPNASTTQNSPTPAPAPAPAPAAATPGLASVDTDSTAPEVGLNGAMADSPLSAPQIGPARPSDPTTVAAPEPAPEPAAAATPAPSRSGAAPSGDLQQIKQQALQSLEPLVDKLDQSPEDKFKTMMMLVQASDNSNLLTKAYDAAGKIGDEKLRAQALLDVVNEINYFTHKNQPAK